MTQWGFLTIDCNSDAMDNNETRNTKSSLAKEIKAYLIGKCPAKIGNDSNNNFIYNQAYYAIRVIANGSTVWWSGVVSEDINTVYFIDIVEPENPQIYTCNDKSIVAKAKITPSDVKNSVLNPNDNSVETLGDAIYDHLTQKGVTP